MLGRITRHHNKVVSKFNDHGLHMKSVNNRKLNSISPSPKNLENFDFIQTRNFPLSPQNLTSSKFRTNKVDLKIKQKHEALRSA